MKFLGFSLVLVNSFFYYCFPGVKYGGRSLRALAYTNVRRCASCTLVSLFLQHHNSDPDSNLIKLSTLSNKGEQIGIHWCPIMYQGVIVILISNDESNLV